MPSLTFCLNTCGEHTEKRCLDAISSFRHQIEFVEVRNVFPQIKALNKMVSKIKTEYFIPLDADMILDYDAFPRIKNALNKHWRNPQWHSILFSLWDTLTEQKILALKILRTSTIKEIPFRESPTPDIDHYKRLTEAGYTCIDQYIKQKPIGKHVVEGKHFCYNKYKDVYLTLRSHGWEWDRGAFMGGESVRDKAVAHYSYFMHKWLTTGKRDYLYCIAGMTEGLSCPITHKSKSLKSRKYINPKWALGQFVNWYLETNIPVSHPEWVF